MGHPRKTIVACAAGLAGVLGMAGVAAAAHGSSHAARGNDDGATTTIATQPGATSTSEPEHATPEPGDDNGHGATEQESTTTSVTGASGEATTTIGTVPEPGDDHGNDAAGDDNGVDTSTTLPDETSTSAPSIPDGMQTFTVSGGTVTVDIESGVLSLVSVTPNVGVNVKDQRVESGEVRVDFRGPDGDSRVRVRIEDGQLRVESGDH